VNRQQPVDALEFDQQDVLDNQIRSIAAVDARAFVVDWDFDLRFEIDAGELQLLDEAIRVSRFLPSARAFTTKDTKDTKKILNEGKARKFLKNFLRVLRVLRGDRSLTSGRVHCQSRELVRALKARF
jgi:hypothetical protein